MSTEFQPGDRVLMRGEVIEYINGVGALVELFSKTDQYSAWVRPDLLEPKGSVVLDPEHPSLRFFVGAWRDLVPQEKSGVETTVGAARYIADQIEAQTKPPRIPEPGLWGVVLDAHGNVFVRLYEHGSIDWHCEVQRRSTRWDRIESPVLIREGVES